jgi:hypothetical protein
VNPSAAAFWLTRTTNPIVKALGCSLIFDFTKVFVETKGGEGNRKKCIAIEGRGEEKE